MRFVARRWQPPDECHCHGVGRRSGERVIPEHGLRVGDRHQGGDEETHGFCPLCHIHDTGDRRLWGQCAAGDVR